MKKRKFNFEDYLTNIYRQANGKPLDASTVQDYLSYCGTGGEWLHSGDDGVYWIANSQQALAYEAAVRFECSKRYADPHSAVRAYNAYREFLEYQENKRASRLAA